MRHSGFRKLFSPPVSTLRVMSLSSVTLSVIFPCQTAVHIMEHWLHSSPLIALSLPLRHNKDIALVNLANVLHRAHFSADAAVVVHAALDDSDFFTSYYTLGNMYAMLREYNPSLLCYDHALQAKPGFEQAIKKRHAICPVSAKT